jgi:hypothetical protein
MCIEKIVYIAEHKVIYVQRQQGLTLKKECCIYTGNEVRSILCIYARTSFRSKKIRIEIMKMSRETFKSRT